MKSRIKYASLLCGIMSLAPFVKNKVIAGVPASAIVRKVQDVKPEDVIAGYLKAIGGSDNINKIMSVSVTGNFNVQGQSLPYVVKKMNPNKTLVSVTMNGTEVVKTVFDGTAGYKVQMGNKTDLTPEDTKRFSDVKGLFPQVFYAQQGYKLEYKGTEKVGDKPAYKIAVTSPSGITSTEYYDSASSLLVREDATQNGIDVTTTFDDYRAVNNVLFPYKTSMDINAPQGDVSYDMVADSIKANEGVADTDFK